jgi:hypothetical protein
MSRWCPFAEKRPLATAQGEPRMRSHDIVCVHTMAGYLTSTDGMFRSGGWTGTESHFGLGGKWGSDLGGHMDGKLFQWQDLLYQADANLDGNPRVISIETADNAFGEIEPWTGAQVETLVRLLDWLCSKEAHADCPPTWLCHQIGIPRVVVADSGPTRRGIAYHRLGIPASSANRKDGPWLKPGCEKWSSKGGKVCPSDARIAQLRNVVVPRVAARQVQEDDFDMDDKTRKALITDIAKASAQKTHEQLNDAFDPDKGHGSVIRRSTVGLVEQGIDAALDVDGELGQRLAKIEAKLDALTPEAPDASPSP